jgi:hypothetical protein
MALFTNLAVIAFAKRPLRGGVEGTLFLSTTQES